MEGVEEEVEVAVVERKGERVAMALWARREQEMEVVGGDRWAAGGSPSRWIFWARCCIDSRLPSRWYNYPNLTYLENMIRALAIWFSDLHGPELTSKYL